MFEYHALGFQVTSIHSKSARHPIHYKIVVDRYSAAYCESKFKDRIELSKHIDGVHTGLGLLIIMFIEEGSLLPPNKERGRGAN